MVQYIPYCGGIKSSKNLKDSPNKSVVYANKKLIVVTQEQLVDTIVTDKSGYIKTTWAYGTYLLYEPWKYYKKIPPGHTERQLDMNCLQHQWAKEDLKIVVSKKTTTVANNMILLECPDKFPCFVKEKAN
ncbi:MAG: hypothetical protein HY062_00075 [Bacteroidetes bacterium]|nr:hypothetical protein [Bacteroidota bacterium]